MAGEAVIRAPETTELEQFNLVKKVVNKSSK